jgi:hypothetical protein
MRIIAIVEKGKDGLFSIWSEQSFANHFFGGYGASVEEAKKDFLDSVTEALSKCRKEDEGFTDPEYDEIHIYYRFDIPSFFNYFDWINVSEFARYAGINESKMRQYKNGLAYPGERTTRKIMSTVKKIQTDFASISI